MKKLIGSIIVAGTVLAPAAFAKSEKPVSLTIEYDTALLEDEATALELLASIEAQARNACMYNTGIQAGKAEDTACTSELVSGAVSQISAEQTRLGKATPAAFTSLAPAETIVTAQR
jgi:UrcA family protein